MRPLDYAWEDYADEYLLDKEDKLLKKMFEWVWCTAVNESTQYLTSIGQTGVSNLLHDYMYKDFDLYDEDEGEEEENETNRCGDPDCGVCL